LAPRDQTRSEPAVVAAPLNECQPDHRGEGAMDPRRTATRWGRRQRARDPQPPGVLIAIVTCW